MKINFAGTRKEMLALIDIDIVAHSMNPKNLSRVMMTISA
jgi:hypothetical protein